MLTNSELAFLGTNTVQKRGNLSDYNALGIEINKVKLQCAAPFVPISQRYDKVGNHTRRLNKPQTQTSKQNQTNRRIGQTISKYPPAATDC